MKTKQLNTGEIDVGRHTDVLLTGGVGSCVVLCLWDTRAKVGGMAHVPMPSSDASLGSPLQFNAIGKAPDTAIPHLLRLMETLGARREDIIVKMIGGGNMFPLFVVNSADDIGMKNVQGAYKAVEEAGLRVQSQSIGGHFGRSVRFEIGTGKIQVTRTDGQVEIL